MRELHGDHLAQFIHIFTHAAKHPLLDHNQLYLHIIRISFNQRTIEFNGSYTPGKEPDETVAAWWISPATAADAAYPTNPYAVGGFCQDDALDPNAV